MERNDIRDGLTRISLRSIRATKLPRVLPLLHARLQGTDFVWRKRGISICQNAGGCARGRCVAFQAVAPLFRQTQTGPACDVSHRMRAGVPLVTAWLSAPFDKEDSHIIIVL